MEITILKHFHDSYGWIRSTSVEHSFLLHISWNEIKHEDIRKSHHSKKLEMQGKCGGAWVLLYLQAWIVNSYNSYKNEKSICRNRHRDRTSTAKKSEPHKERITLQIESLYLQQFMQKDDMIKSM